MWGAKLAFQSRIECLGKWHIHIEIMLRLVGYNTHQIRPQTSGKVAQAYQRCFFLSAGGRESMNELEFSLASSMFGTTSCSPLRKGRCEVEGFAMGCQCGAKLGFYALGGCLPVPRHLTNALQYYKMT